MDISGLKLEIEVAATAVPILHSPLDPVRNKIAGNSLVSAGSKDEETGS
jgi:hypothetical protein